MKRDDVPSGGALWWVRYARRMTQAKLTHAWTPAQILYYYEAQRRGTFSPHSFGVNMVRPHFFVQDTAAASIFAVNSDRATRRAVIIL